MTFGTFRNNKNLNETRLICSHINSIERTQHELVNGKKIITSLRDKLNEEISSLDAEINVRQTELHDSKVQFSNSIIDAIRSGSIADNIPEYYLEDEKFPFLPDDLNMQRMNIYEAIFQIHVLNVTLAQKLAYESSLRRLEYEYEDIIKYTMTQSKDFYNRLTRNGFKVNAIPLTNFMNQSFILPDFKIKQDTLLEIFKYLTEESFKTFGMKLTDIQWVHNVSDGQNSITSSAIESVINNQSSNFDKFKTLLEMGIGFIPSCIYLSLPSEERSKIQWSSRASDINQLNIDECCNLLFYCFFFIFTQAVWPSPESAGGEIAKSLIIKRANIETRLNLFYSCNTTHLAKNWIHLVNLQDMPIEFVNRFALGVAGYRIINAIAVSNFPDTVPSEVKKLKVTCTEIMAGIPDKNVHPVYRNPKMISKYGSLNKSLSAVLAEYLSDTELTKLRDRKVLYSKPEKGIIDPKIYNLDILDFTSNKFENFASLVPQ